MEPIKRARIFVVSPFLKICLFKKREWELYEGERRDRRCENSALEAALYQISLPIKNTVNLICYFDFFYILLSIFLTMHPFIVYIEVPHVVNSIGYLLILNKGAQKWFKKSWYWIVRKQKKLAQVIIQMLVRMFW